MIAEAEACRVEEWVEEAKAAGANVLIGGQRGGSDLLSHVACEYISGNESDAARSVRAAGECRWLPRFR